MESSAGDDIMNEYRLLMLGVMVVFGIQGCFLNNEGEDGSDLEFDHVLGPIFDGELVREIGRSHGITPRRRVGVINEDSGMIHMDLGFVITASHENMHGFFADMMDSFGRLIEDNDGVAREGIRGDPSSLNGFSFHYKRLNRNGFVKVFSYSYSNEEHQVIIVGYEH